MRAEGKRSVEEWRSVIVQRYRLRLPLTHYAHRQTSDSSDEYDNDDQPAPITRCTRTCKGQLRAPHINHLLEAHPMIRVHSTDIADVTVSDVVGARQRWQWLGSGHAAEWRSVRDRVTQSTKQSSAGLSGRLRELNSASAGPGIRCTWTHRMTRRRGYTTPHDGHAAHTDGAHSTLPLPHITSHITPLRGEDRSSIQYLSYLPPSILPLEARPLLSARWA